MTAAFDWLTPAHEQDLLARQQRIERRLQERSPTGEEDMLWLAHTLGQLIQARIAARNGAAQMSTLTANPPQSAAAPGSLSLGEITPSVAPGIGAGGGGRGGSETPTTEAKENSVLNKPGADKSAAGGS